MKLLKKLNEEVQKKINLNLKQNLNHQTELIVIPVVKIYHIKIIDTDMKRLCYGGT